MLNVVSFAVGEKYGHHFTEQHFLNYNFHILTDTPDRFTNSFCKYHTTRKFNYFHKLYFAIEMAQKNKSGVYVVDDDKLHLLENCNLEDNQDNLHKFKFAGTWPNGETIDNYANDPYWVLFYRYLKFKKVDTSKIKLHIEQIFYLPYISELTLIESKLRELEDIFCLLSFSEHSHHNGICGGEGLALSYVLYSLGLDYCTFNINPYTKRRI